MEIRKQQQSLPGTSQDPEKIQVFATCCCTCIRTRAEYGAHAPYLPVWPCMSLFDITEMSSRGL